MKLKAQINTNTMYYLEKIIICHLKFSKNFVIICILFFGLFYFIWNATKIIENSCIYFFYLNP